MPRAQAGAVDAPASAGRPGRRTPVGRAPHRGGHAVWTVGVSAPHRALARGRLDSESQTHRTTLAASRPPRAAETATTAPAVACGWLVPSPPSSVIGTTSGGIVKLTKSTSIASKILGYWALARRGPTMLGIKNSRQPQLDNTQAYLDRWPLALTGVRAWAHAAPGGMAPKAENLSLAVRRPRTFHLPVAPTRANVDERRRPVAATKEGPSP